ncbi:MAG: EndoU domain-containing protein [Gammaproteobacteria bacterium]
MKRSLLLLVLLLLAPTTPLLADRLWTQTEPPVNATHIFKGEINRRGKPTGFHAMIDGQTPENVRLLRVLDKPNRQGVYTARIAIRDPDSGAWKTKFSTLFPDRMQGAEVIEAILHAYRNREQGRSRPWRGPSGRGFPIEGYLLDNGRINTAYPIYVRDR